MQKAVLTLLITGFLGPLAEACPQLQGTFRCRTSEAFDLTITEGQADADYPSYTMSDPTGVRSFIVDGQTRELAFKQGKGEYRAHCEDNVLLVEVRSPEGEVFHDRYYIERAALVRVRRGKDQASSLSCAPTQGTWRMYPH